MRRKVGRPKSELKDLKNKSITMRLTPGEYYTVKEYAQNHNLTITKVL